MLMSERFRNLILIVVFALVFGLVFVQVYAILHEAGHGLAGLAFGGRITDFDVSIFDMGAHVGLDGEFNRLQAAVIDVGGLALPLLVWLLLVLLLPQEDGQPLFWSKLLLSMTLCSLLVWMFLPLLALKGDLPPGEDVTRFLAHSGLHPLVVGASAWALFLAGWALFLRRTGEARRARDRWYAWTVDPKHPHRKLYLVGIAGVLAGIFILAFTQLSVRQDLNPAPAGYLQVAQIDLDAQAHEDEVLYRFTAREGEPVGVYVRIENVDTPYLDLTLVGADGQAYVLLHGESFSADTGDSQGTYGLASGEARLVLTSRVSPGTLEIYLEETPGNAPASATRTNCAAA
jgi:hypothetical protein